MSDCECFTAQTSSGPLSVFSAWRALRFIDKMLKFCCSRALSRAQSFSFGLCLLAVLIASVYVEPAHAQTAPAIIDINIVSQPALGGTYLFDETIEVALTFDETVTVTGVPLIELNIGGPSTARYVRGSGSDTLIFAYTVEADVFDDGDGISVVENTLAQDGDINMGHRGGAGVAIVSDDDTPIDLSNSARDFPDVRVDGSDNPTLLLLGYAGFYALAGDFFTAGRELAMPLITGPNADGYLLQSVELPVTRPDVAGFSDLTVALRSASEDGPGDVLATFTAPGDDVSGRPTFTLPSRAFLQPNTTYFISYLNNSTATFNFFAAQIGDLETGSFEWISAISPNCGANDPTITLCLYIRDMPSAPWAGAPLITGVPAEYFGSLVARTEVRIIDEASDIAVLTASSNLALDTRDITVSEHQPFLVFTTYTAQRLATESMNLSLEVTREDGTVLPAGDLPDDGLRKTLTVTTGTTTQSFLQLGFAPDLDENADYQYRYCAANGTCSSTLTVSYLTAEAPTTDVTAISPRWKDVLSDQSVITGTGNCSAGLNVETVANLTQENNTVRFGDIAPADNVLPPRGGVSGLMYSFGFLNDDFSGGTYGEIASGNFDASKQELVLSAKWWWTNGSDSAEPTCSGSYTSTLTPLPATVSETATTPSAPLNLQVQVFEEFSGVLITWSAPDDGGAPITAYRIYWRKTDEQQEQSKTVFPSNNQYFLAGIDPDADYAFAVTAWNELGEGERSTIDTLTIMTTSVDPALNAFGESVTVKEHQPFLVFTTYTAQRLATESMNLSLEVTREDGTVLPAGDLPDDGLRKTLTVTTGTTTQSFLQLGFAPDLDENADYQYRYCAANGTCSSTLTVSYLTAEAPTTDVTAISPRWKDVLSDQSVITGTGNCSAGLNVETVANLTQENNTVRFGDIAPADNVLPPRGGVSGLMYSFGFLNDDFSGGTYGEIASGNFDASKQELVLSAKWWWTNGSDSAEPTCSGSYTSTLTPLPATVSETATTPSAPLNLQVQVFEEFSGVLITWSAPDDGGAPITAYRIYWRKTDEQQEQSKTVFPSNNQYFLAGIDPDADYAFAVTAWNELGEGERSTAVSPPASPTDLSATAGHKRVILEWMTGDGGGSAITHYQYRQKVDGEDFSGWMNIPDGDDADSDAGNETSYTVTGLTNGTSYLFQVRAVNALGAHSEATAEVGARPFLIEIATGDFAITDVYVLVFSALLDITNEQVIARPVYVFVGFIGGVRMSGIEPDEIEIGNGEILLVRVGDECGFGTPIPDNVICIEILPTGPKGSQLTMSLPADVADLGNAAAPDFYRREIVRSDGIMAEAVSMPDGPILTSEPFVVTFTFSGDGILIGVRGAAADNVPFPLEDYLEPEEIEVVYSPPAPSGGTFIRLEVSNSSASMGHTNIDITLRARQRYEGVLTVTLPAGSARNIYGDSLPETSFSIEVDTFHPIGIVASSTFVVEGTTAVFTLMRDGLIDRETEVTVEVTETNEMVAAADEGRKSVAFAAGSSTAIFSVPTVEDISDEDDSVVTVRVIGVGSDYVVDMTQNIATVTIRDNDAVPDAPADLAAAAGDTHAVLSWDAPADSGASPIDHYEYRASSDGGTVWNPDWTDAGDATSEVRTQIVTDLTNDTEYTFEVRAVSAIGNGTTAQVTATPSSATAVFILMFDPTEYTVNESDGRVELTLRLTGVGRAPQDKVTVTVSTREGSADILEDYRPFDNAEVVFSPEVGVTELSQTVTAEIVNDNILTLDDQSFSVVITDGTAAHSDDTVVIDRGRSEATVTIVDDGVGPRWNYLQELPSTVNESTGMNTVSIRLGQGEGLFDGIYTIMLEVGGTATFEEDYIIEFVSGRDIGSRTLPFTKGDRLMRPIEFMDGRDDEGSIHIRELRLRLVVTDDTVYEADETIELRLTTSHPAATVRDGDDTTQTITLIDNDTTPVLSLSVGATVIDEGASVDITVMTTATESVYAEDQTITLEFTGDAMPEDDYTVSVDGSPLSSPYELTLPAGASSVTATITATEDTEIEADETITITARHEGDTIGEVRIVTITDNDAVPGAPQNVMADAGDRQIIVTWEAPGDGAGDPHTSYRIGWAAQPGGTTVTAVLDDPATTTYTIEELENDTEYTIEIAAVNMAGATSATVVRTTPTAPPLLPPGAPQNVMADAGDRQIIVTWQAPGEGAGDPHTSYRIGWAAQPGGTTVTAVLDDPTTTTYTIEELENGTEYTIEVAAVNASGATTAEAVAATPAALLPAPDNFSVVPSVRGALIASWDQIPDAIGYRLSWTPPDGDEAGTTDVATTSYDITGLMDGATYEIMITALNRNNQPGAVATAQAVTLPPAPRNVRAIPGDEQVTVTWEAPDLTTGGVPERYTVRWRATNSPAPATEAMIRFGHAEVVGSARGFGVNEDLPHGLASHEDRLYMVGSRNDALYTLDPETGIAVRVGTAFRFGVVEFAPRGLASHDDQLYMVGAENGALYTLDPATGIATRVGTAFRFGVNEFLPAGLASHGDQLYMVGLENDALYTLDPATGIATRVGTATDFGVNEDSPTGLASHGDYLYMVGLGNAALYTLDPATGIATRVGTAFRFGVDEFAPSSLASHDDQLYMVGRRNDALYRLYSLSGRYTYTITGLTNGTEYTIEVAAVNASGATTAEAVAATPAALLPAPDNFSVVPSVRGVLIASWDQVPDAIGYRLSWIPPDGDEAGTTDVATTSYDITGLMDGATYEIMITALNRNNQPGAVATAQAVTLPPAPRNVRAIPGDEQVTVTWEAPDLTTGGVPDRYTVRWRATNSPAPATEAMIRFGHAEVVGSARGFGDVNEFNPFGLASHDDQLYMVGRGNDALYTLDPETGLATRVGTATAFGVNEFIPSGLASHGDQLYMVGRGHVALYTLDPATGVATRVGTSSFVDFSEIFPSGLASHGDQLYMVGERNAALYTLDPETGLATRVGTAFGFGDVNEFNPFGLASHDDQLYMVGRGNDALYTLDPATGIATRVGTATGFGVNEFIPTGLASHDDQLYMVGEQNDALYRLYSLSGRYTYTIRGLTNGTEYTIEVAAVNASGATTAEAVAATPAALLPAPDNFSVVPSVRGVLIASWDQIPDAIGYRLSWTPPDGDEAGTTDVATTSYDITGLMDGATYEIMITALNRNNQPGAVATAQAVTLPPAPGAPRNVRAIPGDEQVTVTWEAPDLTTGGVPERYTVRWRATNSPAPATEAMIRFGHAEVVGSARGFGDVNEFNPFGLASHDDQLYMVGRGNDTLYTLDPETGLATRVGTATAFGDARGLASHDDQLYMVDFGNPALYTLDPATGVATRVGTAFRFGVGELFPSGLASDGDYLYMVGADKDALYTLNPQTGVATRVGTAIGFGDVGEFTPRGLASHGDQLYMVGLGNAALYTLDPATGVATRVGTATGFGVNEFIPTGLASHDDQLYMVGEQNDALYRLYSLSGRYTYTIRGLTNGTEYTIEVAAVNASGATTAEAVAATPAALLPAPDNFSVVPSVRGVLIASWDQVPDAIGYRLSWTPPDGDEAGTTDVATTSYDITGLMDGVTYEIMITALNRNNQPGAVATAQAVTLPPAPGAPRNVRAIPGDEQVTVTWEAPDLTTGGVPDRYTVRWRATNSPAPATEAMIRFGHAEVVGSARQFGVNEDLPHGLASHEDRLYMVGERNDALHTLDPETGIATRVGTAFRFGVNEDLPRDLASHDDQLYMVGFGNDALYTLDPATGIATRVGTATGFGVNEFAPRGLASHDDQLYMVGAENGALYTLDPATGLATRVGTATGFGVNEFIPTGLASHGDQLYMVGRGNAALYTLDPATGIATRVGTATGFGVNEFIPTGLASHDEQLYMVSLGNAALYRLYSLSGRYTYTIRGLTNGTEYTIEVAAVNASGATTAEAVAATPAALLPAPDNFSVVPSVRGVLIASWDQVPDAIGYRLSWIPPDGDEAGTTDVATTSYDITGLMDGATYEIMITALNRNNQPGAVATAQAVTLPPAPRNVRAIPGDEQVTVTWEAPDLTTGGVPDRYTVRWRATNSPAPATEAMIRFGHAEVVGSARGFGDVNEFNPSGLASHDGQLYMVGHGNAALHTLDPETGLATRVGTATAFGVNEFLPRGLASHGDQLYMVGFGNDALHTLDPATGIATRVGTATGFGVNEFNPDGLASHDGQLYMVGNRNDALYTLDPATGIATRVGTATGFGVDEFRPIGLASHGDQLYMVGEQNDALYTLDPATGIATRVGTATGFGVNEFIPTGLASHDDQLYMVGEWNHALYRLYALSGRYTYTIRGLTNGTEYTIEVAAVNASGATTAEAVAATPAALLPAPDNFSVVPSVRGVLIASWDQIPDAIGYRLSWIPPDGDEAGTTDVATTSYDITGLMDGAIYEIMITALNRNNQPGAVATAQAVTLPPAPRNVRAIPGDEQVTVTWEAPDLTTGGVPERYTVRWRATNSPAPATEAMIRFGHAEVVGSARGFGDVNEFNPFGLASHDDQLYMVGRGNDTLYTLDPETGLATRVGTATAFGDVGEFGPRGLASHDDQLYMVGFGKGALYTLDPNMGVATRVGTGFGDVGEDFPSGLASDGDYLYMVGADKDALYTLNPQTGVATRVGTAIGFGDVGEFNPRGLASHGDQLYMVGLGNAALYTLDPATGIATRVGTATGFGVNEDYPTGLASHDDQLYMVGAQNAVLYRLYSLSGRYTYTIRGLTNGTEYTIEVAAVNASGATTAEAVAATPAALLPAPDNFSVVPGTRGVLIASWDQTPDAIGYRLSWTPPDGDEAGTTDVATTSYDITGLMDGVTYEIMITALNRNNQPGAIATTQAVTLLPAPTGFNVDARARGILATSWQAVIGATTYRLSWTPSDGDEAGATTTSGTSYRITGLPDNTAYEVTVAALNRNNEPGEIVTAQVMTVLPAPSVPRNVTTRPGDRQITVTWQAPDLATGGAAEGYRLRWLTTVPETGTLIEVDTADTTETSYVISDLTNDIGYTIEVAAFNPTGVTTAIAVTATPLAVLRLRIRVFIERP